MTKQEFIGQFNRLSRVYKTLQTEEHLELWFKRTKHVDEHSFKSFVDTAILNNKTPGLEAISMLRNKSRTKGQGLSEKYEEIKNGQRCAYCDNTGIVSAETLDEKKLNYVFKCNECESHLLVKEEIRTWSNEITHMERLKRTQYILDAKSFEEKTRPRLEKERLENKADLPKD